MPEKLILVRHPQVTSDYRAVCYGRTDVALSNEGQAQIPELVTRLAAHRPTVIYHSGLTRTRLVAMELSQVTGTVCIEDQRLQEMNFGTWEGQTWQAIYEATGNAMDGFLNDPNHFAPLGGETTFAMRDRVLSWYHDLPAPGCVMAIIHGGPIAALRGTLGSIAVTDWPSLVPACGEFLEIAT